MGVEITVPKAQMPADPLPAFNTADASKMIIPAKCNFPPSNIDAKRDWVPQKFPKDVDYKAYYKAVHRRLGRACHGDGGPWTKRLCRDVGERV